MKGFGYMKTFLKRLRKYFRYLKLKYQYLLNKKSFKKNKRKKVKRLIEYNSQFSAWSNFIRYMTGCDTLEYCK